MTVRLRAARAWYVTLALSWLMLGMSPQVASAAVGDIVLYPSDVSVVQGNWARVASSSGAGGEKMASADRGFAATNAALASPAHYFEATFTAVANRPYRVWLRLRGTNESKYNESVWVQFDDAVSASGAPVYRIGSTSGLLVNLENCGNCGISGWGWQDRAYWLERPGTIQFASGGTHRVRVQTREDGVDVDQIVLSPTAYLTTAPGALTRDTTVIAKDDTAPVPTGSSTPFNGFVAPIPGTLQAEGFDSGGEGVAYHDAEPQNLGGIYRNEGPDIAWASGGTGLIGWVGAGEWLKYTVNVQSAGTYNAEFRVASLGAGGTLHLESNGTPVSGSITVPNTGDWQGWRTISAAVTLAAGQQVLRLVMDSQGQYAVGNFDWFRFTLTSTEPAPVPPPSAPAPTPTGSIINVPAGGNLQAAINAARPGDTILLQPGATYTGVFELPNKSGNDYITIRSAAPDSALPGANTRITPAYRSQLPRLVSVAGMAVILTQPGAHHYRLQFLELTSGWEGSDILQLGDGSANQSLGIAHDLIVDRCYLHGDPVRGQKRGIALNSASTTIVNSYFSDIKSSESDAQAIAAWNGPGPYTITNNYLEASGENVMFGGSDPTISGLVPSDITLTRNTITKQPSWRGERWTIKNLIELKNAQRITIDGNIIEYNWAAAQVGYGILLTPRNQDGTAPWSVVRDVQITNNVIRHVAGVFNILGRDYTHSSEPLSNVTIRNNLIYDLGSAWGGQGRFLLSTGGDTVTIDHNTIFTDGSSVIYAGDRPVTGFTFTNNIMPNNAWAIMGTNSSAGTGTLNTFFPNAVFLNNIVIAAPASQYPAANFYPADIGAVGFVDLPGGNYRLSSNSPYRNAGTDGTDVGVLYDALSAAIGGGL